MKIKFFLFSVVLAAFCCGNVYAQYPAQTKPQQLPFRGKDTLNKVTFGLKAGVNFNQMLGSETFKEDYVPGFAGGVFVASTRKRFGMQAEAMVSSAKYNKAPDSFQTNAYFSITYADIVAVLEFEPVHRFWLQAGGQFSTFIAISQSPAGGLDPKNYFQSSDFSAVGGLEVRLPAHINVGVRYVYGFSNLRSDFATITTQDWLTRAIHIYAGYRFK